jgi:hypothetical protein
MRSNENDDAIAIQEDAPVRIRRYPELNCTGVWPAQHFNYMPQFIAFPCDAGGLP